jgi:hypothetical protein
MSTSSRSMPTHGRTWAGSAGAGARHRRPRVRGPPRRIAQELAEGVRHAYEQDALSDTLVGRLHDLIDSPY